MLRGSPERAFAYVARAALRASPWQGAGRPAVLMYHNVCHLPVEEASFYQHVLPHQFAEQMALLKRRGYRVVPLEPLVAMVEAGRPLPARTVAITFDDGYRDLMEVWPHLERLGYVATLFLATGYIGRPGFDWLESGGRGAAPATAPLSWVQVRELARRGADLGSHTVSHLPLEAMDEDGLLAELTRSREDIEWRTGRQVRLFSIPFACCEEQGFRRRLARLLRRAGYSGAVTSAIGRLRPGADVMALPRLPVNAKDTLVTFEAKLEGAYDWLRPLQRAYKLWLKPLRLREARPAINEASQLRGKP